MEWRHSETRCQWEFGYWHEQFNEWVGCGYITDELIAGSASLSGLAFFVQGRFGSVPPPLQPHLPRAASVNWSEPP